MNPDTLYQIRQWLGTGSINIFGRPFAGKDTQGTKLAELFNASLLGGGDILRGSTIPPNVNEALKKGELIPSQDYVNIVLPYLSRPEFAGRPLILSSVGRWIGEEAGVITALDAAQHTLKCVIYLELSEDLVRERWKALESHDNRGNRADDTAEILENRLVEYHNKTLPVLDVYDKAGLLLRLNGSGTPDEVFAEIISQLNVLASSQI